MLWRREVVLKYYRTVMVLVVKFICGGREWGYELGKLSAS